MKDKEYLQAFIEERLPKKEMSVLQEKYCMDKEFQREVDEIDLVLEKESCKEWEEAEQYWKEKVSLLSREDLRDALCDIVISEDDKQRVWEKLTEKVAEKKNILKVQFQKKDEIVEEFCFSNLAAGVSSGKIPFSFQKSITFTDKFFQKGELTFLFSMDDAQNNLVIEIHGGDSATRSLLECHIFYKDNTEEILYGKDIKKGGFWKVPLERARNMENISIVFLGE